MYFMTQLQTNTAFDFIVSYYQHQVVVMRNFEEEIPEKKKAGRKAQWSNSTLDDFIDIIVNNTNYQRKLIITNTKNQQNSALYDEVLKELKTRCTIRKETIDFSVTQLRNCMPSGYAYVMQNYAS